MKLQEKLTARAEPFLEPGERVRHIFMARSGLPPNQRTVNPMTIFRNAGNHVIVVTNRAVVVLDTSLWRSTVPRHLAQRLHRTLRPGPVRGLWAEVTLDRVYYVHKRFHEELRAAQSGR